MSTAGKARVGGRVVIAWATALAVGMVGVGAPAAGASPDHQLPFRATVTGSAQLTSASTGTFTGTGNATHLGAVIDNGGVVAHFDQPSDACPFGFASTNTETFTAANGDSLSIESTDVTCPVGPDHPTQFNGSGHWHVTTGTGRFQIAVGSGSYTGVADFGHNYTFTFTGTISYPQP